MVTVTLPALGEGISKAVVSFWFAAEGDSLKKDDDFVELTTDKAAFNMPCPCAGTLRTILKKNGQTVSVGEALAIVDENTQESA